MGRRGGIIIVCFPIEESGWGGGSLLFVSLARSQGGEGGGIILFVSLARFLLAPEVLITPLRTLVQTKFSV